jgi:hypothetical protein
MPGSARRARLVTDWTTGLLFGRDSAELGQLGHPPDLGEKSAGGSTQPTSSGSTDEPSEAGGDEIVSGAGVRLDH